MKSIYLFISIQNITTIGDTDSINITSVYLAALSYHRTLIKRTNAVNTHIPIETYIPDFSACLYTILLYNFYSFYRLLPVLFDFLFVASRREDEEWGQRQFCSRISFLLPLQQIITSVYEALREEWIDVHWFWCLSL